MTENQIKTIESRRRLLKTGLLGIGIISFPSVLARAETIIPDSVLQKNSSFAGDKGPQLEAALVQDFVRLSHFNAKAVKEMVKAHPSLVFASWDWGGGDFETGLGAASHVGNREIAEFLLEKGARPNIFSAAMLGQIEVVKGFLTADPSLLNCNGPHGLSLIHHATKGGEQSEQVLEHLKSVG